MKSKFDKIKNLSNKEIVTGIKLCVDNSNNLFDSALALQKNRNFDVATSILILSVEELIKGLTLFNMLIVDIEKRETFREIFESKNLHKSKHSFALFMNEFFKHVKAKGLFSLELDPTNPEEISSHISKKINLNRIINNAEKQKLSFENWFLHANERKNAGFYIEYNNKWVTPKRIDEKEFSKSLKETNIIRKEINNTLNLLTKKLPEELIDEFVDFMKNLVNDLNQKMNSNESLT